METIIVRYLETVINQTTGASNHAVLGTEIYDNVREALIPGLPQPNATNLLYPVFLTKCFVNVSNHLWRLESVTSTAATATDPAVFSILIKKHDVSKEIFLNQTLKKDRSLKLQKLLGRQGTLVEVDYGFVQQSARSDASIKSNKRYMDTVLKAEMHKRRLAVVIKVISVNLIQVAPVTSKPLSLGDKSAFKMEQTTLNRMPRYQNSGKDCYVLCSMLECVSIQRVLPPVSYFSEGKNTGRNVKYTVALSGTETKQLKVSLIHAVGASGYVPYNYVLQTQLKVDQLQEIIDQLKADLKARDGALERLVPIQHLAERWAVDMGLVFEEELEFQRNLDAADETETEDI